MLKKPFLLGIMIILSSSFLSGQDFDKEIYRNTIKEANNFFEKKDYPNAAKTYQKVFDFAKNKTWNRDRLKGITAYAFLKNEKGVSENLKAYVENATSSEMEELKVNEVFKNYHRKKWWKDLEVQMDDRLAALIAHHKNLTIFKHNRKVTYSAIRINAEKDTVANTFIHMIPDGTGWGNPAASSQSQILCHYEYTDQDYKDHIEELREVVTEKFWLKTDTTGIIENEEEVWMHPFRYNEFFKTEIAPFPLVHFPINHETTLAAKSKIAIMRNWGTYSPTMTEQKYFYIGKEKKSYGFTDDELECHRFQAYGHNSKHGISYLEYFFHEKYGFIEMNYLTYDNDKIKFVIVNVEE